MTDKDFEKEIEEALSAAGLDLLEFLISRPRGTISIKAVIYSSQGTGTEECTKAYRLILPRAQMSLGVQDPQIEVLSPGIDRILRTDREWHVFRGKHIKFLMTGDSEWHSGQLIHLENGIVQIREETILKEIPFASIIKAKLDSTHEGENAHGI